MLRASTYIKKQRPRYKGLGKGGVCLLQHYCPFCFKGTIGVSCGLYVTKESRSIDQVQVLHSKQGNGLPPLDLASPGEFCANHELCKLTCLVCGKATIDGTDPEFELFLDFFGGDEDSEQPVTMKYEVNDAMEHYGLVWTDQWDTPVHRECTKKGACKCVVPIGATTCKRHAPRMQTKPIMQAHVKTTNTEVFKPATIITTVKAAVVPVMVRAGVMEKASWLPTPSMTACMVSTSHLPPPVSPPKRKKPVPAPVKPSVHTMRMEEAGASCAFKITQWAAEHPTNAGLTGVQVEEPKKTGRFSMKAHFDNFDPHLHGTWKVNGVEGYKRGDGVFVPVPFGVYTLNEDGTITPDVAPVGDSEAFVAKEWTEERDETPVPKKKKPVAAKPDARKARLQAEASKCAFKLEKWASGK